MVGQPTCSIAATLPVAPLLGQFRRNPLRHPGIAAGPHRGCARGQNDLKHCCMHLATWSPVDGRGRGRLQHLPKGLSILNGAHAVEDYGTCVATADRHCTISFASNTNRTCPSPSKVVPA